MTEEQKRKYLDDPNKCPFCKELDLEGGSLEADESTAWRPVVCNSCKAEWNDIYILTGVELKQ